MTPGPSLIPLTDLATRAGDGPVFVLGAGLGTSSAHLWGEVARLAPESWTCYGLDLPGHGVEADQDAVSLDALAATVIERIAPIADTHPGPVVYAGVSMAGALALHLALRDDCPFDELVVVCGAPKFGPAQAWLDRAELVRRDGLAPLEAGSRARWFADGYAQAHPERVEALIGDLLATDPASYAACCEALAAHDLTDRLGALHRPVTWIGGADDTVCPPDQLREAASLAGSSAPTLLNGVAHQAPLEAPERTLEALRELTADVSVA